MRNNPLVTNKARFYAILFSKIERVQKHNLISGFDRLWVEGLGGNPAITSIENSLRCL